MSKTRTPAVAKTTDEKIENARNLAMFFAFLAVLLASVIIEAALATPTRDHTIFVALVAIICGSSASLVVHYCLQWVGLQFGKFATKQ